MAGIQVARCRYRNWTLQLSNVWSSFFVMNDYQEVYPEDHQNLPWVYFFELSSQHDNGTWSKLENKPLIKGFSLSCFHRRWIAISEDWWKAQNPGTLWQGTVGNSALFSSRFGRFRCRTWTCCRTDVERQRLFSGHGHGWDLRHRIFFKALVLKRKDFIFPQEKGIHQFWIPVFMLLTWVKDLLMDKPSVK